MSDSSVPSDEELESFLGDINDPNFLHPDFGTPAFKTDEEIGKGEPAVDDNIETGFEESTIKIGDGTCRVCGAPTFRPPGLTASGRKKRAPSVCDLHSQKRRVSEKRSFAGGVEDSSQLQRIQDELADDIRLLGTLAGPLLPVTGLFVFQHADPFTIALLKLAKNNQAVLRVLHRAAQIAPIYTVAETVAGTAYAVQVDTRGADPHNTVGQRLGVGKVYDLIYSSPNEQSNSNGNQTFRPAPTYAGTQ
jgi:hypothetical protein